MEKRLERQVTRRITAFEKTLVEGASFIEMTPEEKKKIFKRLGVKFPDRIKGTHHQQRTYVFESNGYKVVVHSGIIGNKLHTPGLSWVMITSDTKRLLVRAFKSDDIYPSKDMLDRITAYAFVMQNMIRHRPLDPKTDIFKDLVEKEEFITNTRGEQKKRLYPYWVCKNEEPEDVFSKKYKPSLFGFDSYLVNVFWKKERKLQAYYAHRKALRFRKDVRNTSKTTKPENRIN